MKRVWGLAVVAGLMVVPVAPAQTAWKFHWQPGQILNYQVDQETSVAEVIEGKKTETVSKLSHAKRWQVLDVEANGTATLQLSLTALRIETTTPSGEVIRFDSAHPDQSTPQLREQLTKYVGQPLAVLRVSPQGKVIEVKESKFGPASRFETEPPFVVVLPDGTEPMPMPWERTYQITLEPPQGTGEKYQAVQKYMSLGIDASNGRFMADVEIKTTLRAPPEATADQIPLLQFQPEGTVTFDGKAGLMQAAHLRIDKEMKGHQGEGSSYRFHSNYTEEYVGAK